MFDSSFEAVFNQATIGILVCTEQGELLAANQHACALFGYSADELGGLSVDRLVPDSVAPRHHQLRTSFNDDPQVRAIGHGRELYAKRKDGSVFPAEISLSYYYQQQRLVIIGYIIDITAKKQAEQTLLEQKAYIEQLNQELEQKVATRTHALLTTLNQLQASKDELTKALAAEREVGELKSRFVTMASHEFRTPLSAALSSASLIEKYPGADQQPQRLRHIHRIKASINQMETLLDEFLSVGRLQQGGLVASWSPVDLSGLVRAVVGDLEDTLKAGQLIHTRFDCPERVLSDASLMRKIVTNLLSNASKFSAEHQSIAVSVLGQGATYELTIKDEGIGISEADQPHLFKWFFRGKNALNIGGTGLGLHLVAQYVNLLGGTIWLQSQLGAGTTVRIRFPRELPSPFSASQIPLND